MVMHCNLHGLVVVMNTHVRMHDVRICKAWVQELGPSSQLDVAWAAHSSPIHSCIACTRGSGNLDDLVLIQYDVMSTGMKVM